MSPRLPKTILALPLALVLAFLACGDDPTDPGPFELGVYDLVSVGDSALPAVIDRSATDTLWIDDGRLVFSPDSTLEAEFTFTFSDSGVREEFETEIDAWWGTTPENLVWIQFPGDVVLPPPDTLAREPDVLILERGELSWRFERDD